MLATYITVNVQQNTITKTKHYNSGISA